MNGLDLVIGKLVRVVVDLNSDATGARIGEVVEIGPDVLGGMPSWAMVRFDGDDEFTYRFNVWDLEPTCGMRALKSGDGGGRAE